MSGWAAAAAEVRALTPAAALGRADGRGGAGSSSRRGDVDSMDTESLLFGAPSGGAASSAGVTESENDDDDNGAASAGRPSAAAVPRAERDGPPLGPLEIRRRRAARNRASAGRSRVKKKAAAVALEQSLTGAREENGRLKERMAQLLAARAQLLVRQAGLPPLGGGGRGGEGRPVVTDGVRAPPLATGGGVRGGTEAPLRQCPADGLGGLS